MQQEQRELATLEIISRVRMWKLVAVVQYVSDYIFQVAAEARVGYRLFVRLPVQSPVFIRSVR